jgi:hypothetical protein
MYVILLPKPQTDAGAVAKCSLYIIYGKDYKVLNTISLYNSYFATAPFLPITWLAVPLASFSFGRKYNKP